MAFPKKEPDMTLKRFGYKSTKATRAEAQAVIAHAEGRSKDLPGFDKRLVMKAAQVKKVRAQIKLTQRDFAHMMNVDISTVQNWEQGRRIPEGPAVAMMLMLPKHPQLKGWLEEVRQLNPA
jgi:DNA-binding transcriptional regulator YiaG